MNRKSLLIVVASLIALLILSSINVLAGGGLVPSVPPLFSPSKDATRLDLQSAAQPEIPLVPMGNAFTYQGRLKDGIDPANGQYDFAFSLYDASIGGSLVAGPITQTNRTVTDGLFTTTLDFGSSPFNGDARYMQIRAKRSADPSYTTLSPRQVISPAPYALHSSSAPWSGLTGVPAGFADNKDNVSYGKVAIVALSGGDYTSITSALTNLASWCGTPSSFNPCLVKVGPGSYFGQVTMQQYVDIEGSGELLTEISYSGSVTNTTGIVVGADNAELRFLTVNNSGGGSYVTGVYNNGASLRLLHVTVDVSSGSVNGRGVVNENGSDATMKHVTIAVDGLGDAYGVYNNGSSPTMTDVTVAATFGTTNYGVYNRSSSPQIRGSVVNVKYGTSNDYGIFNAAPGGGSTVLIDSSIITADLSGYTIHNESGFTTRVGATRLADGPVQVAGGTVTCAGVYNASYTFYPSTCP